MYIGLSKHKIYDSATIIGNYMKLKTEEPTQRALTSLSYIFKCFMLSDSSFITHSKRSRVYKTDTCTIRETFCF